MNLKIMRALFEEKGKYQVGSLLLVNLDSENESDAEILYVLEQGGGVGLNEFKRAIADEDDDEKIREHLGIKCD